MAENKKFKPKYYTKIPLGKDKYRYFYSKEEYMAYLKDKKTDVEENVKNGISNITDKGKKLFDNISKKNNVDAKTSTTSGKKIVDSVLNMNKQTKTSASVSSSETKKSVSKIAEKGKQIVDEHLDKISDQAVNSPETAQIVKEAAKKAVKWARGGLVKIVVDELKETVQENKRKKERLEQLQRNEAGPEQREKERSEQRDAIEELSDSEDQIPGLDIKDEPYTDAQDMEAINPYYDGSDNYAYSNNCAYCTAAYELRQRGYDVEAAGVGYSTANTLEEVCSWYEGEEVRSTDDFFMENNVDEASVDDVAKWIEDDLLKHGDGARGQFLLYWAQGGGHSVAWEVVDNDVILRDCQTNEILDVADYLQYASGAVYFRTDNVELSDNIKKAVVNTDDSRRVRDHL